MTTRKTDRQARREKLRGVAQSINEKPLQFGNKIQHARVRGGKLVITLKQAPPEPDAV